MKKQYLLLITICLIFNVKGQDFSNKGQDFWVGYGSHEHMYNVNTGASRIDGGTQNMILYFTSDVDANITVTIPATGWTRNYFLAANTILESDSMPKLGADDARLYAEGLYPKKGIHITSDQPVVAYAHIYEKSVSGATLLFPTNTLGKEYYSLNYKQSSNAPWSYSFCFVIATEDNTSVEITPSANTLTHPAGLPFVVNLMKGDVYNLFGQLNADSTGADLTGTKIKSVSPSNGTCKKIAVFSGSGKLNILCNKSSDPAENSSDNTIQQAFPSMAWGTKYYAVPTQNMPFNYFRVLVKSTTTTVKVNGIVQSGLVNNSYYDLPLSNIPLVIEADEPILVAQYITTRNQCGNTILGRNGDPEMIYLTPARLTIDKITLNSTSHYNIVQHWINVVIASSDKSTFRVDGILPGVAFQPFPADPLYSYAQIPVTGGPHHLQAASGFNAIAYGYGDYESYGYNAGVNFKDIYQFINTYNEFATANGTIPCSGSPFSFYVTLPYQTNSLYWDFHGAQSNVSQVNPVFDSTYFVNGIQLWRYKLPNSFIYTSGTYPITVTANSPTLDGCNSDQEINYQLSVQGYNNPVADFTFQDHRCLTVPVTFTDNSDLKGTQPSKWLWDFGDNSTLSAYNPSHIYGTGGTYTVHYKVINEQGCVGEISKSVVVNSIPTVQNSTFYLLLGGTVTLEPITTGSNLQYLWSPSFYLDYTTIKNPTVSGLTDSIVYTLTVTDERGDCSGTGQILVVALRELIVPNTFTPNNDGINDKWIIEALKGYPSCKIEVFNRFGQIIYESKGYGKPWDGKMNGKELPVGTYYYIIEPGNGRLPVTGYVTLIK
jgi:gliding motility-associated-like protein